MLIPYLNADPPARKRLCYGTRHIASGERVDDKV